MHSMLYMGKTKIPFRVASVERFGELRELIFEFKKQERFSRFPLFQEYIKELNFHLPQDFKEARSVILIASPKKMAKVNFHYLGRKIEITIPAQYYENGLNWREGLELVRENIVPEKKYRLMIGNELMHLKLLSVMCGLGKYGRNNICYVDGMGSFNSIYAYFTDAEPETSPWGKLEMMQECSNCTLCFEQCPNSCISEEEFIIDVEKCIPLYNEGEGEFPGWMDPNCHNALMGCVRCQINCPGNSEVVKDVRLLEDISEEETRAILNESTTEEQMKRINKKLSGYSASGIDFIRIFSRNLRVLLEKEIRD